MSNKNKLHVRFVVGSKEESYIAKQAGSEAEQAERLKQFVGHEEDYVAKMDFSGSFEKGDIFFFKRGRKPECIVLPKQVENPVTHEKQSYPYIEDAHGMRVGMRYEGSTTAGFLYGEYKADPGDAVTMVHVSQMMTKNVKKIHGTAKFPIGWGLVGIGVLVVIIIVARMACSKKAPEVPVIPEKDGAVVELYLSGIGEV